MILTIEYFCGPCNLHIFGIQNISFNTVGIHRGYMTGDDHRGLKKIQCWIPVSTWEQIEAAGYTSPKLAMTKAIELLLGDFTGSRGDLKGVSGDSKGSAEISELKARIEEKEKQIEEKTAELKNLIRNY